VRALQHVPRDGSALRLRRDDGRDACKLQSSEIGVFY
jgi:hypothetical protein